MRLGFSIYNELTRLPADATTVGSEMVNDIEEELACGSVAATMQCLGNTPFACPRVRLTPRHQPSSYSSNI